MAAEAFGNGAIAIETSVADWQSAVRRVGELLETSGRTTSDYTQEMIDNIEALGPYAAIAPGIALAHARPSESVLSSGAALLAITEGVSFGSQNDPIRLVFGFAAFDTVAHIDLMKALAIALSAEANVNGLLNCSAVSEIRQILDGCL